MTRARVSAGPGQEWKKLSLGRIVAFRSLVRAFVAGRSGVATGNVPRGRLCSGSERLGSRFLQDRAGSPAAGLEQRRAGGASVTEMRKFLRAGLLRAWVTALAVGSLTLHAASQEQEERAVILVPVAASPADTDLCFLSALAAAATGDGPPLVLAVDAQAPWRPELLDLLRRAEPGRLFQLGALPPPPAPWDTKLEATAAADPVAIACELAGRFFSAPKTAVLCNFTDRASALGAAVLAARLKAPLLPCRRDGIDDAVRAQLVELGVSSVLSVGAEAPSKLDGLRVERLKDALAVTGKLASEGLSIEYVAVVQAEDDRASHAAQLSLAGALLAVARHGTVAIAPGDVRWKERSASTRAHATPKGAAPSPTGWYSGEVADGKSKRVFAIGVDPADQRAFVQFDRNGDGDFGDRGEEPLRTGAEIVLGERSHSIDLDVDEKARGQGLWLTAPTAPEVVASLQRVRAASRSAPDMLCLVGWPDALPMSIVASAQPIDADLVSDLALAQTDADPFVDLAFARFVAEDLPTATLLACRGFAESSFRDRSYARRFATAEWGSGGYDPLLIAAGMERAGHHEGADFLTAESPLTRAALIQHGAHSMWTEIGKTYAWDSAVLLAPCLVDSSGCSTAALDMDAEHRSAPLRMLRNGALAFVGNRRRGSAQQELFRTEFLNALLVGQSLGEAHRTALNRVLVALLDGEGQNPDVVRYQLHSASVFGDPALRFDFASSALPPGARVETRGSRAIVTAPETWFRSEYAPLAEWNCPVEKLTAWRALGVGVDSTWFAPRNRNHESLVFTAELRTQRRVRSVKAIDDPGGALAFSGRSFVDEHEDGARSVYWRARLVDCDPESGEIRSQRTSAEFRLD